MVTSLVRGIAWGWTFNDSVRPALQDITLSIGAGERVLVTGPSGGGKSTLIRALAGVLDASMGTAIGTLDRPTAVVGYVGQEPDEQILFPTVAEEIGFVAETAVSTPAEVAPRIHAAMTAVGMTFDDSRSTASLSGGEKQRVAIAAALAGSAELLVMDEPTASLDDVNVAVVRDAVAAVVAARAVTLVVVEHRLDVWQDIVDRIIVVANGRVVMDAPFREALRHHAGALREWGVRVPVATNTPNRERIDRPAEAESGGGCVVLRSDRVTAARGAGGAEIAVPDIEVRSGECVALMGATGSGKTAALRVWGGLAAPRDGAVEIVGLRGAPHRASARRLRTAVSSMVQNPAYGFAAQTVLYEASADMCERLGLSGLGSAHPHSVSGGERRRLGVAIALSDAPPLALLDEPTFGQDALSWGALVAVLRDYVRAGGALVVATHDPELVSALGARVVHIGEAT